MRLILLFFTLILASCATPVVSPGGIPLGNFHQVDPGVYRSAQPDLAGMAYFKKIGVKTIVDLNDDDDASKKELSMAQLEGISFVYMPMSGFFYPDAGQVKRILQIVNDPTRQPVAVHCQYGQDRTGLIIALYRVLTDHWTKDAAHTEWVNMGFHQELILLNKFFWDH